MDTRFCGGGLTSANLAHLDNATGVTEAKRRADVLLSWGVTFIRIPTFNKNLADTYAANAAYRSALKQVVDYITSKGVVVELSLWVDPTIDDSKDWLPTAASLPSLSGMARDFSPNPYVAFGVTNEPHDTTDAYAFGAMKAGVDAIRATGAKNVVFVQGTQDWGRSVKYYLTHPMPGGPIGYEIHVYNNLADVDAMIAPADTLPILIGEFGPIQDQWHQMALSEIPALVSKLNAKQLPWAAWNFHENCSPNLIATQAGSTWDKNSVNTPVINAPIFPTDYGTVVRGMFQ